MTCKNFYRFTWNHSKSVTVSQILIFSSLKCASIINTSVSSKKKQKSELMYWPEMITKYSHSLLKILPNNCDIMMRSSAAFSMKEHKLVKYIKVLIHVCDRYRHLSQYSNVQYILFARYRATAISLFRHSS